MVVVIEKVILNQHFELRKGYLSEIVTGKLILEKIPWCYSSSSKSISTIFGFVKRPCDAILMFCSCVLDAKMKTCEETEAGLLIKCLYMKKQLHNEIRSGNLIILILQKCAYFV